MAEGFAADLLVVDGDPAADVTVLGDRRNLRAVVSRGQLVDLDRKWPDKAPLPGSRVGSWAAETLTWDLVNP